jgi:histidine triad (HIT) family protein
MRKPMPESDPDCIFCKIVADEIPAERVAESELSIAFRDLDPQAPTHVLVIPRRHCPTLPELASEDPASAADVLVLARRVAVGAGLEAGYRVVFNNGAAAQQSVFHAHAHVLSGRPLTWPPG